MQNARKGKPKYYPASDEEELVDWIYRNRQEGLTVTGDAIIAKAKEVIIIIIIIISGYPLEGVLHTNIRVHIFT